MLLANNGSKKTGTTWIQRGLYEILDIAPIPSEAQDPKMVNSSVRADLLAEFVEQHDRSKVFYSKSHYLPSSKLGERNAADVLVDDRVVLINSIRNVGDALVSWYHHCLRLSRTSAPFEDWFTTDGLAFVKQYGAHHVGWHTKASPFLFSYRKLKVDYRACMIEFLDWSGLDPNGPIRGDLNEWASIEAERKRRPSAHLRTGRVGEHRDVITPGMASEVEELLRTTRFLDVMPDVCAQFDIDFEALLPFTRRSGTPREAHGDDRTTRSGRKRRGVRALFSGR